MVGCTRARPQTEFPELGFTVDSTQLGERFVTASGGMTLRPPAGWIAAPADTLAEAMRRLGRKESAGNDEPRLRALYRDLPTGAALAVSEYGGPCPSARRDRLVTLQERGLREHDPAADVKSGRFGVRGLEIVQLRAVQDDRVVFKLLVSRPPGPLFQLDYVLPRGVYMSKLRAVESSIGSIEAP